MSNPNSVAQPQPTRPPLPPQQSSFPRDFPTPNGRPASFPSPSPQIGLSYSSPSPLQYNSPQYPQPPAAKRPRLSPDIQSPFSVQSQPQTPVGQPGTPLGPFPTNGSAAAAPSSRPGLMAPPQRPAEKPAEDRNYDDILAGTGINIEEEARNLTRPDYFGPPATQASFSSRSGSFDYTGNTFGRPGSSGTPFGSQTPGGFDQNDLGKQPSAEEKAERDSARADWEAARHTQHPLWDMFLYGGDLNDKVRRISTNEHLFDTQSGVMVNTQKQGPPPSARVNGLEGATRVIDRGQAILDTGQKGERLSDILKLICLATKSRLTGLLNTSARLSLERREHSNGKIPTEWESIAVQSKALTDGPENAHSPSGSSGLKRSLSQANSEAASQDDPLVGPQRVATVFQRLARAERAAEEARRNKRAKRKATENSENPPSGTGPELLADAALAAALDPEKKTTKKERKLAESRFSEQQQHKSANEAARMAVSGLMGSRFGSKKQRTYDWMNAGKGGAASPALTPGRPSASASTSAAATPAPERPKAVLKDKPVGQWDEDKDPGIQARDVLLVLETDGRAPKSYVRGYSLLES